ncbi:MAG TPA: carbohydrate kinase [Ilumatobacter sp.]|nr:carbohydrate kinase [Ilumatobacter sp.]
MIGVIGEALVDLVIAPDGSVVAHLGGGPYNTARAAGRLGADVSFYGTLSRDRFGRALADQLTVDGVDVSHAMRVEQPSTLAAAELDDDGAATYRFYTAGTSAQLFDADAVDLTAVDIIFTGGLALVLQPVADEVERLVTSLGDGVALMVDVNCRPRIVDDREGYRRSVEQVLSRAHVIKVSTDDLRYFYPDLEPRQAARTLAQGGTGVVLLTDGGADVTILTAAGERSVPVPEIEVVDTVGAGDAFCGGFMASAQARGSTLNSGALSLDQLADVVRDAVGVSAIACQRAGADPPTASEVPGWIGTDQRN